MKIQPDEALEEYLTDPRMLRKQLGNVTPEALLLLQEGIRFVLQTIEAPRAVAATYELIARGYSYTDAAGWRPARTIAGEATPILYQHDDGRYGLAFGPARFAVNEPAWHRFPLDVIEGYASTASTMPDPCDICQGISGPVECPDCRGTGIFQVDPSTRQSAPVNQTALLRSASHALRSYQYGNASPDLAQGIADKIDAALIGKE